LRELILSLALRGLLVPQSCSDESAEKLLTRSRQHCTHQMEAGCTKREKSALPVTNQEMRFVLPKQWTWCRIVDTGEYVNGLAFKPSDWGNSGRPIIRIQNLSGRAQDFNRTTKEVDASVIVRSGDILVSWSATLDAFVWSGEEGVLNQHIFRVTPSLLVDKKFLYWLLKGVIRELAASDHAHGLLMSHINRGPFLAYPVAIPPAAEQARIVARVEELMRLCDALEAHGRLQDEQHARLVATLFDALAASASAEELAENWQRIAAHFDLLLDRPEAVDALEQAILQLAVRGLLVPQDPTDEPASKLLQRISMEKDLLIAEGKIKRAKSLPPITDEEKPFELPAQWEWIRVASVGATQTGGTPASNKPEYFDGNFPFIGPGQITPSGEILPPEKFISELGRAESAVAEPGDILMVCIGGSIGKCAATPFPTAFNQQINSIRPLLASGEFILTAMTTSDFVSAVVSTATGSATPIISKGKWDLLLLPLPPLAEQHRIVARVEQLRRLCAELRGRLQQARVTQSRLADALVSAADQSPSC